MKYNETMSLLNDFRRIFKMSNNKAMFSLNCTLYGRSELLSEKFRTFLFKLFTISNLDRQTTRLKLDLIKDLVKLNDFYNDGKILMNLN